MTVSLWRYSHLALAVSSFIFILLATLTGIILAVEPVVDKPGYDTPALHTLTLNQTLDAVRKEYKEVTTLTVHPHDFVSVSATTQDDEQLTGYIHPATGNYLGDLKKQTDFFRFVTNLHRSLFLHGLGRFFIGLSSFLLLLIAISGTILIIQRQQGLKRFFSRMINENFFQYYHAFLGRLSLLPIIIIAASGTYLSLVRFEVVSLPTPQHTIDVDAITDSPKRNTKAFAVFSIPLSQVETLEFPFSDSAEDYFTLKLKDRELAVNQYTGEVLSEVLYPWTALATRLSLDLHTGRSSVIWAVVLAIACINILFFIYSGFAIYLKRRTGRIENPHPKDASTFIILTGSENGSTLRFAHELHNQLLQAGETSFLCELNQYTTFAKAAHLVVFTSTYGQGHPPSNADRFLEKLSAQKQNQNVEVAVVGFGSLAYPHFCQFAKDVDHAFSIQPWVTRVFRMHTIHDKSVDSFEQWVKQWTQHTGLKISINKEALALSALKKIQLTVINKTVPEQPDEAFLIQLKPLRNQKFQSGDLLAVYPANDYRERHYSIGKVNGSLQLSVKLHGGGLGSGYLYALKTGDILQGNILTNEAFHFPQKASRVILISNGTGIAPFLGMIDENTTGKEIHLYCGFRNSDHLESYRPLLESALQRGKLHRLHVAYSRQGDKNYVHDLITRDEKFIAQALADNCVIMLCGSLAMQKDVERKLEYLAAVYMEKPLSFFRNSGQLKTDCY